MKKVLIATSGFHPIVSGASYVMTTLVEGIKDFEVFVVTSSKFPIYKKIEMGNKKIYYVANRFYHMSSKLERFMTVAQTPLITKFINFLVEKFKIDFIIGVYPSAFMQIASYLSSRQMNVPFISYFHDIPLESYVDWESNIIKDSYKVIVIHPPLKSYFENKYNIKVWVLNHSIRDQEFTFFKQNIFCKKKAKKRETVLVWAGNPSNMNFRSLERLIEALKKVSADINLKLLIFGDNKFEKFYNVNGIRYEKKVFKINERLRYLKELSQADFGIASVDWEDESSIRGFDEELKRVFPTKILDYMLAGLPIIAHCPQSYFLAEFVEDNSLGKVILSRNIEDISKEIKDIFQIYKLLSVKENFHKNVLKVLQRFSISNRLKEFHEILS